MWIYISASMVLTIDWQQRIQQPDFQLQNGAAKVCCRNFIRASCFSILRKDLLYLLKKEDLDDKFLKKQVQRLLWKFNSGLEICAGIYHSDHDDTLKNAFYSGVSALTQFFYSKDPIHIYQDQT